jgi:hypothetical protein
MNQASEAVHIVTSAAEPVFFQEYLHEMFVAYFEANDCHNKEDKSNVITTYRTLREFLRVLDEQEKKH